ncbi:MAG: radical SAM protein, partial [Opitutaceae bacterium]
AGGVSIGINLRSDKVCNFNCVYCEVDRHHSQSRIVDIQRLEDEVRALIEYTRSGELFLSEPFARAPQALRQLKCITFSGDGEPTASPVFLEAATLAVRLRDEMAARDTRVVLITNSACLDRPGVRSGLHTLAQGAHEIWAKLDAGTEAHYQAVNRSQVPFVQILGNLELAARVTPLFVQTLFLRLHGMGPSQAEIMAYCDRLETILAHGGRVLGLQLCTVARPPAEPWATALADDELLAIATQIKTRIALPQQLAFGKTFHIPRQTGLVDTVARRLS